MRSRDGVRAVTAARRSGVLLLALAGVACGGGGAGGDGGGGSTGSGGGGGSAAAVACPTAAPTSGTACSGTAQCFYEDCSAAGRTVASCAGGTWTVETGPCTNVFCQSMTCAPGQICMMVGGGALLISCADNSCGTSAVSCGCLQSCAGSCSIYGSLQSGVTISCNTCGSNLCP
jgi:hypothetical protein